MNINVNKVKICVMTPKDDVKCVREAVCNAGAGVIGNYTYCTTSTSVTGTFKPNDDANPFIGTANNLEYVSEEKLEFICDISKVKEVLKEIRKNHSYEEPEIDIIPLIDEDVFK